MGSVQSVLETSQANTSLKELGVRFKIRTTKQSPYGMVVARSGFEDGSKTHATSIKWAEPGALKRLYQLCLDMEQAERPLDLLKIEKATVTPQFNGWTALVGQLQAHLDKKGIQWVDQDYARHMRQLGALTGPVTAQKLQKWVEQCQTDVRDYERRLTTIKRIMTCCPTIGIDAAWLTKAKDESNYSPDQEINKRTIPSEHHIELFIDSIPTPMWRQYFAFIAVYGLRTHEPFTIIDAPDEEGFLEVESRKTGYRAVFPRRDDWIDRWDLRNPRLPEANPSHTGKQLGNRASTQFYRYRNNVPELIWRRDAQCYDLRHAFADAFHTKSKFSHLTLEEVCRSMGHSKKIHEKHYKRWLDKKELKAQAARRFRNR
tara:strand:+ start:2534 stop:3652 length:1119 start_codon:yes stop_codon:yes gene_type:complete